MAANGAVVLPGCSTLNVCDLPLEALNVVLMDHTGPCRHALVAAIETILGALDVSLSPFDLTRIWKHKDSLA